MDGCLGNRLGEVVCERDWLTDWLQRVGVDPEDRQSAIEADDLAAVGRVVEGDDPGRADLPSLGSRPAAPVPDADEAFVVRGGEHLELAWAPGESPVRVVGHDGFARLASGHIEEAERAHGNDGIGNGIGLDMDDHLAVRRGQPNQGAQDRTPRGRDRGTW